ncbi:hypothetical protein EST38_g12507 [Candolleomyces aberdarensis]|uniref:Methyltransferase domain-containing protein n=1 Tax=Candolleomyces aberdarensis TaxID=2316362 RepID=A0A4V1Q1Z9_9AGAR|nr:hypothetical protein EST38_g12507 [Candolleomyces aberdarensis]
MSTPEHPHLDDLENGENELSDSSSGSVEEVRDEDVPRYFDERNDRLYHSDPGSPYPLPVDTPEQERCTVNHNVLKRLIGANHRGPVNTVLASNPHRQRNVLDLCTGNGKWVLEMADQFRDAQFIGVDIGISLLGEVERLLQPGGCFLSVEYSKQLSFHPDYNRDIGEHAPATFHFFDTVNHILADTHGVSLDSADIQLLVTNSPHFHTVTTEQIYIPVGIWHEDDGLNTIGSSFRAGQKKLAVSFKQMLLDSGMSAEEVDALITDFTEEMHAVEGLVMVVHITHAERA